MTLNAVIALILCFFSPNSTDFQADYTTVVEGKPIISVSIVLGGVCRSTTAALRIHEFRSIHDGILSKFP